MGSVWLFVAVNVIQCCAGDTPLMRFHSPGDVIIGGLFPVHLKTNRNKDTGPPTCTDFDFQRFLHTQVMIHSISGINQQTPRLLPNVTIGYDIYDTCGDVSLAIQAALHLLTSTTPAQGCPPHGDTPTDFSHSQTKAVIGESASEVSIAVARILTLASVAQLSYGSTSDLLSRKFKFPTFLRTVSSDKHQAEGICKLVRTFHWRTVAVVGSEDEYGRYGSDLLNDNFAKKGVCVEFVYILPAFFNQNMSDTRTLLAELVRRVANSSAEAIVLFTKSTNVELIMEAAIQHKLNRTWVASDAWSTSRKISSMPGLRFAGSVFGFIFKRKEVPGFKEYVTSVFNGTNNILLHPDRPRHPHVLHRKLCWNQSEDTGGDCSQQGSRRCLQPGCLLAFIDQDYSYSIHLTVQVIADSLRRLLRCDSHGCERSAAEFTPSELVEEVWRTNSTFDTTHIFFDVNGDPSLGYDIVFWNTSDPNRLPLIQTIGEYRPDGRIQVPEPLKTAMKAIKVTAYNCSKTCDPGHELKQQRLKCCPDCVPCAAGEFSPGNGWACRPCAWKQYSVDSRRDRCFNNTDVFLHWSLDFSIILSSFAVLGIVVTLVFAALFAVFRSTPIVKALGGHLCFLELLSLLLCLCLTFSFQGKPSRESCAISLPLFGLAFSVCMSCILANLLQILVGFNFNLKLGSWVKSLNRPLAVVAVVSGVQLTLSLAWMFLEPSVSHEEILPDSTLHLCQLQSLGFFGATIAYNAFLALICFLFAFKGKQLPDLYKNATLISVSMLLFLIIWIVFVPLFLTLSGKYKAGIESAAILISTYSILGCHLAPKCYIMVFRKELNNQSAITEYIKKHYEQKGQPAVKA